MYVESIKKAQQEMKFLDYTTVVVVMNDVSTMGMYAWCGTIVNYFIAKNKTSLTKQKKLNISNSNTRTRGL